MDKKNNPSSIQMVSSRVKNGERITEDTPLTPIEMEFIRQYIKIGNAQEAARRVDAIRENKSPASIGSWANRILRKPNVRAEIGHIMDEIKNEAVADATEVMQYFTSVMRGEVKDQFGLEAPLSERTKAAQELARRTIDIENRKAGNPDQAIEITLDWSRK